MYSIEELSTPAKAEALRYGHTALANPEELSDFLVAMSPFLEENEHFSITPLSSIAGQATMFSIKIVPIVKLKPNIVDF